MPSSRSAEALATSNAAVANSQFVIRSDANVSELIEWGCVMHYEVKLGRPGGGSVVFSIVIPAGSPDIARRIAMQQFPGYSVRAVKSVRA